MRILTYYFNNSGKEALRIAKKNDFDFDFGTLPKKRVEEEKRKAPYHLYERLIYLFVKDHTDNLTMIIGNCHRHESLVRASTNECVLLDISNCVIVGGGNCLVFNQAEKGEELKKLSIHIVDSLWIWFYEFSFNYGKLPPNFLKENESVISATLATIFSS